MARYKKGINGPVKGKIGNVVAATCRGIDYLRSLGEPSGKPPTPAQLNQRLRFALVMGWLKPLLKLVNIGFQIETGDGKTPMNRAVSFYLKEVLTGTAPDYEINFPRAVFSRGELHSSMISEVSREEYVLNLAWLDQPDSAFSNADDQATFIVYDARLKQFATFEAVALRSDLGVELQLPARFNANELHIWMNYVNVAGDMVSTSVYRHIEISN